MQSHSTARRTALNVSLAALLLAAGKGVVGLFSGSVAVLSSALDSAGDALSSFVNFLLLTVASKPPDEDHPFGHGKAEHLAAMLQGTVMLAGSVALGIGAIRRIRQPEPVEASLLAIGTMIASVFATIFIARYLKRSATTNESTALAGDALHYTSDILANVATIAALALARWTGNTMFDSIFGVSVAFWIAWNAVNLIWLSANDLMDVALPTEEIDAIVDAIEKTEGAIVGHRELRTRRAAGVRFIEFELLIDRTVSFEEAHDATEAVKAAIHQRLPRTVVTVHAEPVCKLKIEN